jgi:hypothetical protein
MAMEKAEKVNDSTNGFQTGHDDKKESAPRAIRAPCNPRFRALQLSNSFLSHLRYKTVWTAL